MSKKLCFFFSKRNCENVIRSHEILLSDQIEPKTLRKKNELTNRCFHTNDSE